MATVPQSPGIPDHHVEEKARLFAGPRSQRALGSNSQRKASRARVCESKKKGNIGDIRTTTHPYDRCPSLSPSAQGLDPEIVPSTFEENLPLSQFEDLHEYPVATANFKAVEVYRGLVVCSVVPQIENV